MAGHDPVRAKEIDLRCGDCGSSTRMDPDEPMAVGTRAFLDQHRHQVTRRAMTSGPKTP
jgi:hypothetical protein